MEVIDKTKNPKQKVPPNFTGKVIYPNGNIHYYKNGDWHREDGPAVEYADGSNFYYINAKLHRIGGPAVKCTDGSKQYWVYGTHITKKQHDLLADMMKLKGAIL